MKEDGQPRFALNKIPGHIEERDRRQVFQPCLFR
jgi:hypothetical protein